MIRRPPRSPLFPSPTLFRSALTTVGGSTRRRLVPPMLDGMAAYQTMQASFDMPPFHRALAGRGDARSEEDTSELQSPFNILCRLLLVKKKKESITNTRVPSS